VSPSRHRSVGAGIEPLMVVAVRGFPLKFTGVWATIRLNSVPESSGALLGKIELAAVKAGPAPSMALPVARAETNRRRPIL